MFQKTQGYVGLALLSALSLFVSEVTATSVDRLSLTNLEGYAGQTIEQEISLEGVAPEGREGYWYTYYKEVEGDSEQMDITSWITIESEEYTLEQGEKQTFTVRVKIPNDAKLGIYGATVEDAGREGLSGERRSYIVFKDAPAGGNVYSGLLIPISVMVIPSPNPWTPIVNFITENAIVLVLITIIVIMGGILLKKPKSTSPDSQKNTPSDTPNTINENDDVGGDVAVEEDSSIDGDESPENLADDESKQ